jgi:hypothetical protein
MTGQNLAASVDAPTPVCLRWRRFWRRATEQQRSAAITAFAKRMERQV